ncbi:MAG: carboxypeptidase-like regulatory domain-containing protein [Candidatus Altiarchaeota archaeon]|nr:carboxypeptidase-like regulatory domain-containing protein [Candidatus Altiarchaeota archaeon]
MLNKLFILSITLVLLTPTVLAVSLRDMDVNPEEPELEDTFDVEVSFSGDTCGTSVQFFMDDVLFSSKVVGCDRDSMESNEWDLSDDPLDCGKHTLRAELIKDGESIDNITQELMIGNLPVITSPEKPLVDQEFIIHFEDSETGQPLVDLRAEIYDIREGRKSKEDYHTDIHGDLKFKSRTTGEFKLIIDDSEYCGSEKFYVKKTLNIDGPYPAAPVVGELITIAVPGGVGVKVLDESGNTYATGSTSVGGGVNLTINDPGNYTLVIGKSHKVYWGRNVSLYVSRKLKPSIITPEKAVKDKELTIRVEVNGKPLEYMDVTIQTPSGATQEHETDENGKLGFIPRSTGQFLVKVEKRGYKDSEGVFEVKNSFDVISTPREPKVGEDITLFVRDQLNNLVQGATVSLQDTPYGTSGLDGRFTLKLPDPGKYTVKVTRQDYWDFIYELMVLSPLYIELGSGEIELGENITLKVVDARGDVIPADVEVTKPDGEKESIRESYKPGIVGEYKITASKDAYITLNKTFIVNPHPLNLDLELMGDRLLMTVSSHGEPVSNISLTIEKPTGTDSLVTDDGGKAETVINKEGRVNISVNVADKNLDYDKVLGSRNIIKRHDFSLLVLPLSVIVLVIAIAYVVLNKGGMFSLKRDKKEKDEGDRRPTLSRV